MMVLNPFRFGVSGAPTGWTTISDGAVTANSNSWANYTIRTYFSRSLLPAGATKARVTFATFSSGGTKISKAYVGPSRRVVFDDAPTQVFFSGQPGFTLGASQEITSDDINISYDGSKDLCVSFHVATDAGANQWMATRSGSVFSGGDYKNGDQAASTGGTWVAVNPIYLVKKLEIFTGGTWKNILASHTSYPTNWNNYTVRSLLQPGAFTRARPLVRFGFCYPVSKAYIGLSAGGASPFDFASTPTQLLFGGLAASNTEIGIVKFTDEFDMSGYSPGDSVLFSAHTATANMAVRSSPPAEQSSRYKSGDSASVVSWQTGSAAWTEYLGPQIIDEKY